MADGEGEQECSPGPDLSAEIPLLEERLQELESRLRKSKEEQGEEAVQAATDYCQRFCQTLLEYAEKWKASEYSLPLLEVYTVAIQSYAKARSYLTSECENVALVLERLALSCVELLLCLPHELPVDRWEKFQYTIQAAHTKLAENGSYELSLLHNISREAGVWKDTDLQRILNHEVQNPLLVDRFLMSEGPLLLEMRIKRLLKLSKVAPATSLAKLCSDHPEMCKKGNFKQIYLTCLCAASPNIKLIEEIAKVDCKDALDMICNLESDGDEKTSLILCAAFLSRQLQYGELYCAWELTLFWSKLQRRVDPSIQVYLERCRQLSLLTKTVYHIFFLIKVIQSEAEGAGLPTCIELCVRALRLESSENSVVKISICKTISCLLPDDLEVKRACQLTEFLLEPTVDAYYAVEMLYNQPDQKYDEESLPVPNSLRCELLLVLKTRWPFDPEFWDWKTLKRHCLALMGEEASIVSSIDELNDNEAYDQTNDYHETTKVPPLNGLEGFDGTSNSKGASEESQKKKNIKKLRERGYISERFRNWQAYMQYCVLCDKEFLGHRIVRHAQKHCKDGVYSCPICAKEYNSKESFVPHVTLHVKQSCKERLATMASARRLQRLPKKPPPCKSKKPVIVSKQERPIKKNSLYSEDFIVFNDNDNSDDNDDKDNKPASLPTEQQIVDEFPCPVQFCKKGFKYFKNLIAHVKGHKDSEEAKRFLEMQSKKVICQYCRRQFVSLTHLNDHLQMHCGSQPYICIQMKCKASFNSYADLLTHRKEHRVFRARCMFPKCGRIFSAAYMLFDHEAQHYNTFTCKNNGCGKIYHSQLQLEKHLSEHAADPPLQESKCNTNAGLIEIPKAADSEHGTEENSLPESSFDNEDNSTSQPLGVVAEPTLANNSNLSPTERTVKADSISSVEVEQAACLLDHHLSTPTEVPNTNLPSLIPSLSTITLSQSLVAKNGMLAPTDFPASSSSVSSPSPIIFSNSDKPIAASNIKDLNEMQQPNFQDKSLPIFQECNTSCPDDSIQDQATSTNSCENKTVDEGRINNIISFGADNPAPPLCENNLVMPGYEESSKTETTLSLSLETSSLLSNVLPPVANNAAVTPLVACPVPCQRFKCNVEGCTRVYNSVQSIGKHMKTAHPDHYADFKMERKNRKKLKAGSSAQTLFEERTYQILSDDDTTGNGGFQSPVQNATNPTFCNPLQHSPNTVFPTHLENLVNPVLSSAVDSIITQGLSKNVADSLLSSEVGTLTNAALTSQLEDLAKVVLPLKFENGSDPFLPIPTENDPLPVLSSLSGSTMFSQLGNHADHDTVLAGADAANSVFLKEADAETSFAKQVESSTDIDTSFNLEKSSSMLSNSAENSTTRTTRNKERKPKHSARAKCPAIIRDGKFICSRCFRVFTNPRSLGGHLSKRSVCKPHNEYDVSHAPLVDGQPSVLANMILTSSPKQSLPPPPQTFNPEMTLKTEPFLQSVALGNEAPPFLQSGLVQPNPHDFIPYGSKDASTLQELATLKAVDTIPARINVSSESFRTGSDAASVPNLSAMVTPHISQTLSNEDANSKVLNSNVHSGNLTADTQERCLKKEENGLCSNSVIKSEEENHCISTPVSSSRVSVISGPQSSCLTSPKKKGNSSKKKKKNTDSPTESASHEMVKNILAAISNLPPIIGGNEQGPNAAQPNLLAYGSELLENIAKHLNNADKQLFMSYVNESLRATSDVQTLSPFSAEPEKSETVVVPHCTTESKGEEQLGLLGKRFDNVPAGVPSLSVNGSIRDMCTTFPPCQNTLDDDVEDIPDVSQNMISANSPCNIPVCSNSPTQETNAKHDTQVLEIMDLVQKLQLVDNYLPEGPGGDPDAESPVDPLLQTSSVIVPNPSLCVSQEEEDGGLKPLIDKCTAKPFICQENGCTYCAMTKDALFKHYAKVHDYTQERLMEIKKHQLKFAPFRCVVPSCTKTFTRNSNLRAHCQTMHHFTSEQLVKLKIKRPYGKKPVNESMTVPVQEMSPKMTEIEKHPELNVTPPVVIDTNPEPYQIKVTQEIVEAPKTQEQITPIVLPAPELSITNSLNTKIKKIKKKRKEAELNCTINIQNTGNPHHGVNSFRPYQCVHQGCTAAFTIQQNLILHYQAVHKSDMSKFSLEEDVVNEREGCENGLVLREFRCMETDCSRIFQEVASLILHYVNHHEMNAEEIENAISFIHVGQFKCDQQQCSCVFTTCSGYIEHLEETHEIKRKPIKLDDDETYKCDCEGCDRVYATRSNLLRHIFHKHNDKHKEHLLRPRKISLSDQECLEEKNSREKPRVPKPKGDVEGIQVPKAKRIKGSGIVKDAKAGKGQSKVGPLSLKYGRHTYSLKSKETALAECTGNQPKQYPCMVRGCKSVVGSENNVIRHYKSHKVTRAFILRHRKALIVCKRRGRHVPQTGPPDLQSLGESTKDEVQEEAVQPQIKPPTNAVESSDESSILTSQQSETEKDEMDELAELFIAKLSNEDSTGSESQSRTSSFEGSDCQETSSCQSEPQRHSSHLKRPGRQKHATPSKKRKKDTSDETLSAETSSTLSGEEAIAPVVASEEPPVFDLSSFKPMGFEVSFLKFLEESAAKEKKHTPRDHVKAITQKDLQPAEKKTQLPVDDEFSWENTDTDTYLIFANPSHLPDFDNVKIVLEYQFNDYIDLVVKQLNELKPVVVLKRHKMPRNELVSITTEQTFYPEEEVDL
ncbi:zinc finger protein 292 [Spea bombifrons]|uniref:zinc finger protein 292 n=1 Tax=Spea bombifrons TaxID=233779 RepID=UPI00234B5CD7|nr:zinc finger protein 292 [Spea bombifrons]